MKKILYWWRVTAQIQVVTRHQYGISQTSFRGETSGGVAKYRLFSKAVFKILKEAVQWRKGKVLHETSIIVVVHWFKFSGAPNDCFLFGEANIV